jgi:hypothetical protein
MCSPVLYEPQATADNHQSAPSPEFPLRTKRAAADSRSR